MRLQEIIAKDKRYSDSRIRYIERGDLEYLIERISRYETALKECGIGGNSLASVLIGLNLPNGWHDWTHEQASKYFFSNFAESTAYVNYEVFLCWKAIRDALKEEDTTTEE